jgi:GntR family transcriptional regulator
MVLSADDTDPLTPKAQQMAADNEHPRSKGGSANGRQINARRVRDLISSSIRDGHIAPDDPLSEEDLMLLFSTSRGSVRAALSQLRDTGFVDRRPRVGTKVNHLGVSMPLTDIHALNTHVLCTVIEERVVPNFPLVRERLALDEPDLRMVENTFATDNEVIGIRTAYFSTRILGDPRDLSGPVSMAETITSFFGMTPGEVRVSIGSDRADSHTARLLGVAEGVPLIVREITYFTADGEPIQMVFDRFRGDRVRLDAVDWIS